MKIEGKVETTHCKPQEGGEEHGGDLNLILHCFRFCQHCIFLLASLQIDLLFCCQVFLGSVFRICVFFFHISSDLEKVQQKDGFNIIALN